MNTSSDERNPVELLAEEFLDRKRRGEQPTLREYLGAMRLVRDVDRLADHRIRCPPIRN